MRTQQPANNIPLPRSIEIKIHSGSQRSAKRVRRDLKTRERVCLSCNFLQRQTLDCMTYTQRLLNKIPPPTLRLFINLSTIAAIAIMGLALIAH
jgi:hypothetical protein